MSEITICKGATIRASEVKRVKEAMAKLVEDNGANHEIMVTVTLHNHNEYPKIVYKGKETRSVADADQEAAATEEGFGPHDHKAFTAKEA